MFLQCRKGNHMTEEKKQLTENQDSFIMHPTVDFCFKELMENAKVRQGLIAAILKKDPEEIQKTKLMPTILRKEYPEDKCRWCHLNSGFRGAFIICQRW